MKAVMIDHDSDTRRASPKEATLESIIGFEEGVKKLAQPTTMMMMTTMDDPTVISSGSTEKPDMSSKDSAQASIGDATNGSSRTVRKLIDDTKDVGEPLPHRTKIFNSNNNNINDKDNEKTKKSLSPSRLELQTPLSEEPLHPQGNNNRMMMTTSRPGAYSYPNINNRGHSLGSNSNYSSSPSLQEDVAAAQEGGVSVVSAEVVNEEESVERIRQQVRQELLSTAVQASQVRLGDVSVGDVEDQVRNIVQMELKESSASPNINRKKQISLVACLVFTLVIVTIVSVVMSRSLQNKKDSEAIMEDSAIEQTTQPPGPPPIILMPSSPPTTPPPPSGVVNNDDFEIGTCGGTNNLMCQRADAPCCSIFGYCGNTIDYCGNGCQIMFSLDGSCNSQNEMNQPKCQSTSRCGQDRNHAESMCGEPCSIIDYNDGDDNDDNSDNYYDQEDDNDDMDETNDNEITSDICKESGKQCFADLSLTPTCASTNRCGIDWSDANSKCGMSCALWSPEVADSYVDVCAEIGQSCFTDLSLDVPICPNTSRCGVDWTDANSKCGPSCITNDDCMADGEFCFGDLSPNSVCASSFRCGNDWVDANSRCDTSCNDNDKNNDNDMDDPSYPDPCAASGKQCFADLSLTPTCASTNRCGIDWSDANSKCGMSCALWSPEIADSYVDVCAEIGQSCFTDLLATVTSTSCESTTRCGINWIEANSRCDDSCNIPTTILNKKKINSKKI